MVTPIFIQRVYTLLPAVSGARSTVRIIPVGPGDYQAYVPLESGAGDYTGKLEHSASKRSSCSAPYPLGGPITSAYRRVGNGPQLLKPHEDFCRKLYTKRDGSIWSKGLANQSIYLHPPVLQSTHGGSQVREGPTRQSASRESVCIVVRRFR